MKKINQFLLFMLTLLTFSNVSHASNDIDNQGFEVNIVSYAIKSSESKSRFYPVIGFEMKITHPSYKILDANLKKTMINGIYQKGVQINGKLLHGDHKINLLDTVKKPNPNCDYCKTLSTGRFKILNVEKGAMYLRYESNSFKIDDIYKYNVDANVYIKAVGGAENEKDYIIEGVILEAIYLDISEIAKRNITRFSKNISNDDVSFTLKENGLKVESKNKVYFGYDIVNNNEEQLISRLSIIDGDEEVFLDRDSYESPMRTLYGNNDKAFVHEKYLNKPLNIKVYYFDTREYFVHFNQDLN